MKKSIRTIKSYAKKSLQGCFGSMILGMLAVFGLNALGSRMATRLFGGSGILNLILSEIFLLVVSLITGIFSAGYCYMQLNIAREKEFSLGDLVYFFKNQPDRVIIAGFVLAIIQVVTAIPYYYVSFVTDMGVTLEEQMAWMTKVMGLMLLSIVLNLLVSLPFAMTFYIMADDGELGGIAALKESMRLMRGNLGRYLLLQISFIPLLFLSVFTLYLALLWIIPYMEMSSAAFYRDLRGEFDYKEASPENPGYNIPEYRDDSEA